MHGLDDACSLTYFEQFEKIIYKVILENYRTKCKNEETCELDLSSKVWPDACNDKIGERFDIHGSTKSEEEALAEIARLGISESF